MKELRKERLIHQVSQFSRKRLAVVGDLILDEFIWGTVDRISPEAPVPVVKVSRDSRRLGGAANVALNLRSLGAQVSLVGVLGKDRSGRDFLDQASAEGIEGAGIIQDGDRPTTIKTRIIAHHQQVCRTDRESDTPLPAEVRDRILEAARTAISRSDAVVLSDYSKGVLDETTTGELVRLCRSKGKFVAVDPKSDNFSRYRGASIVTPNLKEAEKAWGAPIASDDGLETAGRELVDEFDLESLLITRGARGMTLFEGAGSTYIPTVAREVFDVTGAGDTVIASLSLAVAAGANLREAAHLANYTAGIVVGKLGTATASTQELLEALEASPLD